MDALAYEEQLAMSFKQVFFFMGCAVSWFVALPLFLVGGGIALFIYAVFSEIGELLSGAASKSAQPDAREMAQRVCIGH
jgi:hypothetical protein